MLNTEGISHSISYPLEPPSIFDTGSCYVTKVLESAFPVPQPLMGDSG